MTQNIQLWTHTSVAWGPETPFERSAAVWGNSLQVFSKSPRGWKIPDYSDDDYAAWRQERKKHGQIWGMVHSNYLVNLSKSESELKSEIDTVVHDFEYAHSLWYDSVNVHVWKLKGRENRDEAMKNMVKNVETILKKVRDNGHDTVQYVFENTAGQGSEIGSTFEELAYFYNEYLTDLPVKFTIDTAHSQGWGIDVGKREEFLEQFDDKLGIEQLYAIHLNDSKAVLWSNLDRHASLGRGFIGFPALSKVIKWAADNGRAMYIETPEPKRRPDEIDLVKRIIKGDDARIEEFHANNYKTQYLKKFEKQAQSWGLFG